MEYKIFKWSTQCIQIQDGMNLTEQSPKGIVWLVK